MDIEGKVTELLGADLDGERVLYAAIAYTRRWYSSLLQGSDQHSWYLAVSQTRFFILSADHQGRDWRGTRSVRARRREVDVERFRRAGIMTWTLVLNVHTEGHWKLHGLGWLPGLRANSQKVKQIVESLASVNING